MLGLIQTRIVFAAPLWTGFITRMSGFSGRGRSVENDESMLWLNGKYPRSRVRATGR